MHSLTPVAADINGSVVVFAAGSDGHESVGCVGTVYVTSCVVAADCRQLRPIYQRLLQV